MKHSYEIPVVFRVMPDEETQQAIDQVVAWLENSNDIDNAGSVTRIDRNRLGRRRLAYEIKGQRDGFYVLFYAAVEPEHLPEFELNMRLFDPVLRYLIIRDETTDHSDAEAERNDDEGVAEDAAQAEPETADETDTSDADATADDTDTADNDDESE